MPHESKYVRNALKAARDPICRSTSEGVGVLNTSGKLNVKYVSEEVKARLREKKEAGAEETRHSYNRVTPRTVNC